MSKVGKKFGTKAYPADTKESSNLFRRVEPMMTPEELIARYLKAIPNIGQYSYEDLKTEIEIAMNEVEIMTGLSLFKTQMKERIPYDYALYRNFIHIKTNHRPILSVEKLSVESTNGQTIYELPLEWIEAGFFHKGQVNLLPIMTVFGSVNDSMSTAAPSGALIFLQGLNNHRWLPAFWSIEYTTGISHKDGQMPININAIIGMTAAIQILGALQVLNIYTSQSLSQDGLSQSSSGPGPVMYKARIEQLEGQRDRLMEQIKKVTFNKYFLSNI